ncbi:uncharacterized protein F5147DRAFT_648164 [Suillus discolor]|uniref:Uncharacterized protein n=1 Tax=Suillus discolor TaxID=1912936 RepID=A0A9P7FHZ5_9AGAM|nr:uncharacterized protein F5147DRAFT_648164 [Suillus discolor]KAG2119102.1 hypothetical protein F5147DRAFT_648164 [Suillus discolor]
MNPYTVHKGIPKGLASACALHPLPKKSIGLPKEHGKVQKDCLDLDECEKLPEITMSFRPDTDMCNGYSGQVPSRNKQRKGCRDKVRSRIGLEDHGKVPEEHLET